MKPKSQGVRGAHLRVVGRPDNIKSAAGAGALQNLTDLRKRAVVAIAFWSAGALSRFLPGASLACWLLVAGFSADSFGARNSSVLPITDRGANVRLSPSDHRFLDELERASVLFFWEAAEPTTGLIKDRSRADGPDPREIASIAAVGFGLTALCIADQRGYLPSQEIEQRVLITLRFLWEKLPQEHGFYQLERSALHSSVFPCLVRFSRSAGSSCRLFPELRYRHESAPEVLPRPAGTLSQVWEGSVGNHGVRFGERLCGVGRAA